MKQREIKFRAWDKKKKRMYKPFTFADLCGNPWLYPQDKTMNGMNKDLVVMQYTGLKDKNGKEIYGGDVIDAPGKDCTVRGEVAWNDKRCLYFFHCVGPMDIPDYCGWFPVPDLSKAVIIGNIYENPELVKLNKK